MSKPFREYWINLAADNDKAGRDVYDWVSDGPYNNPTEIHVIEKQAYDKAMFERNAWYEKYREAMGDVAADHILKELGELDDYDPTPSDHKTGAGC